MTILRLKPGREKSVLRRHPWIFSGAVAEIKGTADVGETVEVVNSQGGFLAWGAYSHLSQIQVRIWSWVREDKIDKHFFRARLDKAIEARIDLISDQDTNAFRLVHGESDGIPGLIVDRYVDCLVVQFLSAGVERWRSTLVELLSELDGVASIYERSDVDVRKFEGLIQRTGLLYGTEPSKDLEFSENGLRFAVDIYHGHKTGSYLDQRINRARVMELGRGRDVLDCFCYTGGFSVSVLAGGAKSVFAVDASETAINMALKNVVRNDLPEERIEWMQGDVFKILRRLRDQARQFDMIVLDPPKFAQTASQAQRAARGYKDINLLALKLLRPGGVLVTFSCSGGVSADLFQKIVAGAAIDANVNAQIVEWLHQGPDHPVALNFPEGAYLKGLVLRLV